MIFDNLNDDNFLLYCIKHYDNPQCKNLDEFNEDIKRIKYIKKLLTRYIQTGDLKERLILNHLVILNNVFGPVPLCRILFLKIPKYSKYVKPFLVLLSIMPPIVYNIGKDQKNYMSDDVPLHPGIIEALRKL